MGSRRRTGNTGRWQFIQRNGDGSIRVDGSRWGTGDEACLGRFLVGGRHLDWLSLRVQHRLRVQFVQMRTLHGEEIKGENGKIDG